MHLTLRKFTDLVLKINKKLHSNSKLQTQSFFHQNFFTHMTRVAFNKRFLLWNKETKCFVTFNSLQQFFTKSQRSPESLFHNILSYVSIRNWKPSINNLNCVIVLSKYLYNNLIIIFHTDIQCLLKGRLVIKQND